MNTIIFVTFTYLLASVPFGLILSKIFSKKDLRTYGSGNIGATNAFRVNGKLIGITTLILDFTKGLIPILVAKKLNLIDYIELISMAAVIGHIFPIWLKFKGGKGVSVMLGLISGINFILGIATLITWVIIFATFRISSIASIISLSLGIILSLIFVVEVDNFSYLFVALLLILYRHESNIKALLKGKERSF